MGDRERGRDWRLLATGLGWLLFFPNAPYICTDLVHLGSRHHGHFWIDLMLILLFALTGLMVGYASLQMMQSLVTRRRGELAGWMFVAAVAGLSGWGVYIGRFLRWNSWDLLLNPVGLFGDLLGWLSRVPSHPASAVLPAFFGLFIFIGYLMVHALMQGHPRLRIPPQMVSDQNPAAQTRQK